jgi:hypothetical protein
MTEIDREQVHVGHIACDIIVSSLNLSSSPFASHIWGCSASLLVIGGGALLNHVGVHGVESHSAVVVIWDQVGSG